MGVQEVRWDKGATEPADSYTFFYGNGNLYHFLGTGIFICKGITSAVKRVEIFNDKMSYIMLRSRWCDIVLNVHLPTEDKCHEAKDSFYEELECVFDQFLTYHMKMLGDFNAKVERVDIFKLTIGNKSLQDIGNDNEVRVVNFTTSKNLVFRSTMFPHLRIHKYTWTSPDGRTYRLITC
jgi:hypothetical protein